MQHDFDELFRMDLLSSLFSNSYQVLRQRSLTSFHFNVGARCPLFLASFIPEIVNTNDMSISGFCSSRRLNSIQLAFDFRSVIDYLERKDM